MSTTAVTEVQEITPGFGSIQSFELAQRAAKLLSQSTLVPKEYQDNLPNCVIALNMAARMGADPLMVMQNLYIVQGRPGWSSQFLISTFNTCGRFSALRYDWVGKEGTDDWGCRAWATELSTGEKLTGSTVTIAIAKKEGWYGKNGSKWQTMPQQMLMYRAASWFVRAYAPELAMGMHTEYELEDQPQDIEVEVSQSANGKVLDIKGQDGTEAPAVDETTAAPPAKSDKAAATEPERAGVGAKQTTLDDGPGF